MPAGPALATLFAAATRSVSAPSLIGFAVLVLLGYLLIVRRRRDDEGGGPPRGGRSEPTGRAAGTPDPNRWEKNPAPPPAEGDDPPTEE